MKEDYLNRIAKKIRNKLIYFIHLELKKKAKCNNYFLINSISQKELNKKYQKCYDYCIEKTETYSSNEMNNGNNNNNYFHVSITYCSLNNNYLMLIDKSVDQVIGENNIIGKYYKGNTVNIRSTIKSFKHKIIKKENNNNSIILEKKIIGDKILTIKRKSTLSSLRISTAMKLNNDNNDNDYIDKLNSNHNNYKKLINLNVNNEFKKSEPNCANKVRKNRYPKFINLYTTKLKKYCATLKKTRKREINNLSQMKNQKNPELISSPAISERKKNYKKEKQSNFKSQKEKQKIHAPISTNRDSYNLRYKTENPSIGSNINPNSKKKLRSQTRISHLFKIPEKKNINPKNRAQSIDIFKEKINSSKKITLQKKLSKKVDSPKKMSSPKKISSPYKQTPKFLSSPKKTSPNKKSPKKISPKKISSPKKSPKKIASPKKGTSPKKLASPKKVTSSNKISTLKKNNASPRKIANSMRASNDFQFTNYFQKNNKKSKAEGGCIKKFVSGGIVNKRKIFNSNNNNIRATYKNSAAAVKLLKTNDISNKRPVNKKFKRANTGIYSKFHFKGSENKLKDTNF